MVIGLIAVLVSLLLPVVGKARSAANAANCISNLRQMGMAWTMYSPAVWMSAISRSGSVTAQ